SVPLLLKISPDLSEAELDELLEVVCTGDRVAGVIATNTTTGRPEGLMAPAAREPGGLSGYPLRDRSTAVIRRIYDRTEGRLPIIGVGGVSTAADAVAKLRAGASAVQLYSGLILRGPSVARDINRGLLEHLESEGLRSVTDLIGQR